MSNGRHTLTEFYCHLVCPFFDEQLQFLEGTHYQELPERMCPALASVAIEALADSIVTRSPDSAVEIEAESDGGESYIEAVVESSREYRNLAGACAKMLINEGTSSFKAQGAPDLRIIEDKEVYKRLSSCAAVEE